MPLRIQQNIVAFDAYEPARASAEASPSRLQRLSGGLRVDAPRQDGKPVLSQATNARLRGLSEAQRNTQECATMLQTAVGALDDIQSVLQQMRALAAQATNDALTATQRSRLHIQFAQLTGKIDHVARNTSFGGQYLLYGRFAAGVTVPSGNGAAPPVRFAIMAATSQALGLTGAAGMLSLGSSANAQRTVEAIRTAIETVSAQAADLTSIVNGLRFTAATLSVASENASAASSRITDLEMATEVANAARAQIVSESATAILAHATNASQGLRQLLH